MQLDDLMAAALDEARRARDAGEVPIGAVASAVRGGELPGLNHRFEMVTGVREDECRALMQAFFRERRSSPRPSSPIPPRADDAGE